MGIELDVLVGHPEHDLIFFGVQVAKAAGLRDPSGSVMAYRQTKEAKGEVKYSLGGLMEGHAIKVPECVVDGKIRTMRSTMAMMTEAQTFKMLLRGHAPQSEPFRKWVTEEVLPTIRKTGKYDAEQSSNPIAVGVMDELRALRGGYSVAVGVIAVLLHEFCPIRRGVTLQGKRRSAINHAKAVVKLRILWKSTSQNRRSRTFDGTSMRRYGLSCDPL